MCDVDDAVVREAGDPRVARRAWLAWRALRLLRLGFMFAVRNAVRSLTWDYQTCRACGRVQHLDYVALDWIEVVGHEGGVLCADCFIALRGDGTVTILMPLPRVTAV